jgi:hypothetical protein
LSGNWWWTKGSSIAHSGWERDPDPSESMAIEERGERRVVAGTGLVVVDRGSQRTHQGGGGPWRRGRALIWPIMGHGFPFSR